jgi:hydroxymethylpyrimidine pyrophosphatase-like HAD family hydrolase
MEGNLEEQRKQKFREALERTYAGCLFDIDGTLTVRGDEFIPAFVTEILADMCLRVPMAICSARSFAHAYEKMAAIFTKSNNPKVCQANWILVCENGSLGYYYDSDSNKYVEFFRVDYPYSREHRDSLFARIKSALEGKSGLTYMNEVSIVFRPLNLEDPDREALAKRSHELALIAGRELEKSDPKKCLKIGDSGIGICIFPYHGNKENGTLQFAKLLRDKKGINVSPEAREMVVIGDQPQPYGNDETFLDGKIGTPFTVGETHPQNLYPLPVYDLQTGKTLTGPEGTIYLLQHLKFRTL